MGFARRVMPLSQTFLSCPVCFRATEVAQPHLYHTQSDYGWFSPLSLGLCALSFVSFCYVSHTCASQSWWLVAPLVVGAAAMVEPALVARSLLWVAWYSVRWGLLARCWATASAYGEHKSEEVAALGHRCRRKSLEIASCGSWEDTGIFYSLF